MGHTDGEERRTCNWHARHTANAKLPKAHSREHVLAITSRISMHSLTTASWRMFPNTEYSLGSSETGHTPTLKLCSHKNALLGYLVNQDCLLAYRQIRKTEWHRKKKNHAFPPCTKRYLKYIIMCSSAYGKRKILKGLEEASAHISRSKNIVTTPVHMDKSEIRRHRVPRKHSNKQQEWLALWL